MLAASPVLGKDKDVQTLLNDMNSNVAPRRTGAISQLGELGAVEAIGPLIKCLADDDQFVRLRSREALIKIGRPAIPALKKAISDDNPYRRLGAAIALGELGEKEAIPVLYEIMTTAELKDRPTVANALKDMGWQPQSEEEKIAFAIARYRWVEVGRMGKVAVEPLMKALPMADDNARRSILEQLNRVGDERVEGLMIESLSSKDYQLRWAAANALGSMKSKAAIEPLVACLGDERNEVQKAAAKALTNIGWRPKTENETILFGLMSENAGMVSELGKGVTDKVIGHLRNPSADVRRVAVESLGKIGEKRAAAAIVPLLEKEGEELNVRKAAVDALGKLGDAKAIPALEECLADWQLNTRAAAALEALDWKPKGKTSEVRYMLAKRDKEGLLADWKETNKALLADLRSGKEAASRNAARALISLGQEESVKDLVNHLNNTRDKGIAEVCLNSGNAELNQAAKDWAKRNGYTVMQFGTIGQNSAGWGKM